MANLPCLTIVLLGSVCLAALPQHDAQVERIVVHKSRRELVLLRDGQVVKSYRVALGRNPVGAKRQQGDRRTPEGDYKISGRNDRSAFHRSLRVSYPNAADIARARKAGIHPGGDITIHGLPNGQGYIGKAHRQTDWTDGCIAVTNEEIEEIWRLCPTVHLCALSLRPGGLYPRGL